MTDLLDGAYYVRQAKPNFTATSFVLDLALQKDAAGKMARKVKRDVLAKQNLLRKGKGKTERVKAFIYENGVRREVWVTRRGNEVLKTEPTRSATP